MQVVMDRAGSGAVSTPNLLCSGAGGVENTALYQLWWSQHCEANQSPPVFP